MIPVYSVFSQILLSALYLFRVDILVASVIHSQRTLGSNAPRILPSLGRSSPPFYCLFVRLPHAKTLEKSPADVVLRTGNEMGIPVCCILRDFHHEMKSFGLIAVREGLWDREDARRHLPSLHPRPCRHKTSHLAGTWLACILCRQLSRTVAQHHGTVPSHKGIAPERTGPPPRPSSPSP